MTTDSPDEEYTTFMPHKLARYTIVPQSDDKRRQQQQQQQEEDHYQSQQLAALVRHGSGGTISGSGAPHTDPAAPSADPSANNRRGIFHQIIATCAVLLLSAACGMPIGYSAVLLPQLMHTNETAATAMSADEIAIDIEMGSWIASVHSLATPMGSFISGPLADSFGRRTTLLGSVIPTFLGWSILATAHSYPMLILGRVLCGFATGILGGPGQVYIAETAEANLRGLLIGAPFVSYSMGILIVYALGSWLHWRTVAWCGNVLPLLAGLAITFIPESPNWLLRNKRMEQALKALIFLRGNQRAAQCELNEMSERLGKEMATTKTNENIFKLCCQRAAIKPLVIVITFAVLQMFSGTFIVVFYAVDIISEFGADFDTKSAAICTAVVRMICTMVFCIVLLFIRRRRLLIWSGIGSGLSCLLLSVYQYSRIGEPKSATDIYMVATCLFTYIAFNTALMVAPGIMIGELFPGRIRGRTAGGVFACMNLVLFGFSKTFPMIQAAVRMQGVFMIFAISSFLISIFMLLFQPETKGRTLEQIEDYFNESNWLWLKRNKRYKSSATTIAAAADSYDCRLESALHNR